MMRKIALYTTVFCFSIVFGVPAASAASKGNAAKGKQLADSHCAICHNLTTEGTKMGPSLKGLFKKKKMVNGKEMNDKNVLAQINDGGGGMPAFGDQLTSQQKQDLLAYLHTL